MLKRIHNIISTVFNNHAKYKGKIFGLYFISTNLLRYFLCSIQCYINTCIFIGGAGDIDVVGIKVSSKISNRTEYVVPKTAWLSTSSG